MPILYHELSRQFHLYNDEVSYIIGVLENGQMENLYYGARIRDRESFAHLHKESYVPMGAYACPEPSTLSLQHTRQEYPSFGTGDFRYPAYEVLQKNGSIVMEPKLVSHAIFAGKKKLEPLPATYVEKDTEADSLELTLEDALTGLRIVLSYTIYNALPVITRSVRFENGGKEKLVLKKAMSVNVDLPDGDFEMLHLTGAWSRERFVRMRPLDEGVQGIYSMCGCSSAEHNPFLALKRPDATEAAGEVYGFSFVYSGNFVGQVEVSTHDAARVMMGIHPHLFSWPLEPGEGFQTPEAVMVYSASGMNHMSQIYHELYRTRLCRGVWRDRVRPVLLNNWEATLMDFDEEKILRIAEKGRDVGVELFVLDDGWFGARNDDHAGLGDWVVNTKKLPDGITGLAKKVEAMGLKFGLWIEPEMVNKDSDLYRAHPDWIFSAPGRFDCPSRNQHVLDFSRPEVVDYIHGMISKVIREASISYIKWDMNRYITACYSAAADAEHQGTIMHRYILGVYDLYTRLTTEFPDILFESCASGGARFDPGMLYFAPQAWTSDDTDANERMRIQYGSSFVYPISSTGAHVSAVPNQQTVRTTPIQTRANVAFFGAFGYELDLNELSEEELAQVREQIVYFKEHRETIQMGTYWRLRSPFEGNQNETAWMTVSPDKREAVVFYGQTLNHPNLGGLRLRLCGLDPAAEYEVVCGEEKSVHFGDELMNVGLILDRFEFYRRGGDFASFLYTLKAI